MSLPLGAAYERCGVGASAETSGLSIPAGTPSNYAAISTMYEVLVLSGMARHTGIVPNDERTIATKREGGAA